MQGCQPIDLVGLADLGAGSLLGWLPSGRQAWQAIWLSDCVLPSRLSGCLARWLASWLGAWSETGCPAGWLDSNVVACLPACLNKGLGCYQDAAKKTSIVQYPANH